MMSHIINFFRERGPTRSCPRPPLFLSLANWNAKDLVSLLFPATKSPSFAPLWSSLRRAAMLLPNCSSGIPSFYSLRKMSGFRPRNFVGWLSIHIWGADNMLDFWLSFYVNRLERHGRDSFCHPSCSVYKKADINFDTVVSRFKAVQSLN